VAGEEGEGSNRRGGVLVMREWVMMATAVTASRRSELWLGLVVPAAVALQNNFGRQQPRAFTPRYPSFCLCLPHNTQDGRTSRKQRECCLQGTPAAVTAYGCTCENILMQPAGQGEAQSCSQRQHHRRARYASCPDQQREPNANQYVQL
jgi:hypothetical protein